MRLRHLTALAVTCAIGALVLYPGRASAQQVELKPKDKIKRDSKVILADEIAEHPDLTSGYDVVKQLRSNWLRLTRGTGSALSGADPSNPDRPKPGDQQKGCFRDPSTCPTSSGSGGPVPHESGSPYAESGATTNAPGQAGPVIYFNEIKQQGLNDLKNIRPGDILEMRYMNGTEASGRYGAGHENGAILVKMKQPGGS
jgi:hypothetical protein